MPSTIREAAWTPTAPESLEDAYQAQLGPDLVVRVELDGMIGNEDVVRARRWQIECAELRVVAQWLWYANFQFDFNGEPLIIRWTKFPSIGEIEFPEGVIYRFDEDSESKLVLRGAGGRNLLVTKNAWKESQLKAGVRWVSHLSSEPTDSHGALAAGILLVLMQMRQERGSVSLEGLSPFPEKKKPRPKPKPIPTGNPLVESSLLDAVSPRSNEPEIPWVVTEERPGIHVLCAEFPKEVVKVERLGQTIFNPYGRHTRCIVGEWIAAVENPASNQPNVYSNQSDIALALMDNADGYAVASASVAFREGDSFQLVRHEVAGWRITHNGRTIARHALPWKDSHQKMRVKWVTYLEVEDYPWPGLGMALALLDIIRVRIVP